MEPEPEGCPVDLADPKENVTCAACGGRNLHREVQRHLVCIAAGLTLYIMGSDWSKALDVFIILELWTRLVSVKAKYGILLIHRDMLMHAYDCDQHEDLIAELGRSYRKGEGP